MRDESRAIEERLPHLSAWERAQLHDLALAQGAGDTHRYGALKDAFIEHMRRELRSYFEWCVAPGDKLALRKKFLNITGIWDIIPHDELRKLSGETASLVKRPVSDWTANPWPNDALFSEEIEILAVDLKGCEPFASFLGQFEKGDGVTYLDYLSGSREKRLHPYAHSICFYRSLKSVVVAKHYVSTSADPLTGTIYVALCNAEGKRRDLISICYEMVLQTAFLDFYMNWPGAFQPFRLLRNMTIIALRFLADVVQWLEDRSGHAPDLRWLDPYLPAETFLGNIDLYKLYIENLRSVFMRANLLKLMQLNRRLGLSKDDLGINF